MIRWAKVVDQTRCIGCHACTTACKSENEVPVGVTRTYVKYVDVGIFPLARRSFQVTRCNQCDDAPCTVACPTTAMFRRPDGIVDFDKSVCVGCKACIAACPYDAIFMNPEDHSAEKCNFCAHRLDGGLEPACVVVCPTEAILVGDLNDPASKVARIVGREVTAVRRPEKETHPKLFYKGAHSSTLDPLAAARPEGGIFVWSEQGSGAGLVTSGYPPGAGGSNSSAAAMLAYDIPHRAPWDWRVSLYTVTKSISAGVYLAAWLLVASGHLDRVSPIVQQAVPVIGLLFLAITGALLISDLDHPERFYLIFTRPQWKSWLVRGGFILAGYGAVLLAHGAGGLSRQPAFPQAAIAWMGIPLALLAAAYTGWLFAQAKARDLWQNPLLPPHLCVQALLAGAAALLPWAQAVDPAAVRPLLLLLAVTSGVHLLLVAGEMTLPHATAHAHLAAHEIVRGRWRNWFWPGMALSAAGLLLACPGPASPWPVSLPAAVALAGLLAFEHAYVQGAQSVPLA